MAAQFELEEGFELADNPAVSGDIYMYSAGHGTAFFANEKNIRMVPVSKWRDNVREYPPVGGHSSKGYIFALPLAWNTLIAQNDREGNEVFYLSLYVQFTCRNGNRYSLEIESRDKPREYIGGNRIEILPFYILWGYIEKNARVEVMGKGEVLVSKVKAGDRVLTDGNTYEKVKDILVGEEEILKYIKVKKESLLLTMDHPVMTKKGWKAARELEKGELILCADGKFYPLEEIYDEVYYDKVYSLALEKSEGFFANHICVGDFERQNRFQRKKVELPKEILAELEKFKNQS